MFRFLNVVAVHMANFYGKQYMYILVCAVFKFGALFY